jgi:hypothetical protein
VNVAVDQEIAPSGKLSVQLKDDFKLYHVYGILFFIQVHKISNIMNCFGMGLLHAPTRNGFDSFHNSLLLTLWDSLGSEMRVHLNEFRFATQNF